jgi:hypothetical protein
MTALNCASTPCHFALSVTVSRFALRRLGEVAHIYLPKMTQAVCS